MERSSGTVLVTGPSLRSDSVADIRGFADKVARTVMARFDDRYDWSRWNVVVMDEFAFTLLTQAFPNAKRLPPRSGPRDPAQDYGTVVSL